MTVSDKIKNEFESLSYNKERCEEHFNEAKLRTSELIINSDSKLINELENYTVYSDLRKYAKELEEIKAKLRVLNYLIEE